MDFAKRLKELLEKRCMSQKELAQKAGLTEAAICRYLKGERIPRTPAMAQMAGALGVSMDFLATGKETSEVNKIKAVLMRSVPSLTNEEFWEVAALLVTIAMSKCESQP